MKGENSMSNNSIINSNTTTLSTALSDYNTNLANGASLETMKTYNAALRSALKTVNADELSDHARKFSVDFSADPANAWAEYLSAPWVKVTAIKKEDSGAYSLTDGVTMLPLSVLLSQSVSLFNNTRFVKRAKVLWYLCAQYGLSDAETFNPIRLRSPELYKEIRDSLKEWKACEDCAYMEKVSLTSAVSVNVMEKMFNAIVDDILPAGMELVMRKADVRNIRDSVIVTSIATKKASAITVHNFDTFCVQLVDAMYHRHENVPYEINVKK